MEIRKTTPQAIDSAAQTVGLVAKRDPLNAKGDGFKVRLSLGRPNSAKDPAPRYGRQEPGGGKRLNAVCWHGHRDFMRALLALTPAARIKTAWARYDGLAGFEAGHAATGRRNIGSQARPVLAVEACDCDWGA